MNEASFWLRAHRFHRHLLSLSPLQGTAEPHDETLAALAFGTAG